MFAWSHTTYAIWRDIIFNFEWKRDLDYFLAHASEARRIRAVEAYSIFYNTGKDFVKVEASCRHKNSERFERVKKWYENK